MLKKLLLASAVTLSILSLQACVPVAVGAAAGGGAYLTKKPGFQNFKNDNDINNQAYALLQKEPSLKGAHIAAATKNRNVLLVGEVSDPSQKDTAEKLMQSIPGVNKIFNGITVSGPISALTRSSDDWITTKVKSNLIAQKGFPSNAVKVVTENGTVFLMGTVTQQQGETAANLARQLAGVQRVVKLFDYTN